MQKESKKKIINKPVGKKSRIDFTLSEIERLLPLCSSEEQEFYAFNAVDQCLKRIVSICQQS